VVLFDEIEKAHPDVFNILLQVLDDGRLTDGQGRTVDFKNTLIILTSNIGSAFILEAARRRMVGPGRSGSGLSQDSLRPEFLNRVDDIIVFRQLSQDDISQIVELQLTRLRKQLRRAYAARITPRARWCRGGYDPVFGARPLKRVIQRRLQNPIALELPEGRYGDGDTLGGAGRAELRFMRGRGAPERVSDTPVHPDDVNMRLAPARRIARSGRRGPGRALIVSGRGLAWATTVARRDPTAHAEFLASGSAWPPGRPPDGGHLYVTLEPCAQCRAPSSWRRSDGGVWRG
jgi:hypothetical protein